VIVSHDRINEDCIRNFYWCLVMIRMNKVSDISEDHALRDSYMYAFMNMRLNEMTSLYARHFFILSLYEKLHIQLAITVSYANTLSLRIYFFDKFVACFVTLINIYTYILFMIIITLI
jgi:hypothetical protein